jgi:hypothetical protein
MIEVKEHGEVFKANNMPREGECENCHCKFTYTRDDCWWSSPCLSYILNCPECGKKVLLGDVFDE